MKALQPGTVRSRTRHVVAVFAAILVLAMTGAGAENKSPREEKRPLPRADGSHGGPPCAPKQVYTGHYQCTDKNGVVWECTIVNNAWSCKKAALQPKP